MREIGPCGYASEEIDETEYVNMRMGDGMGERVVGGVMDECDRWG